MIGRLSGTVLEKEAPFLLIEVQGVGYEVCSTERLIGSAALDQPIILYTHLITREEGQTLYGFETKNAKALFRILIKATGVGPKLALSILSAFELPLLVSMIVNQEVDRLVKIPGVGRKTAQRLVIEIKDKIKQSISTTFSNTELNDTSSNSKVVQDATSALEVLGYKRQHAMEMIQKIDSKEADCAELVRLALKNV